MGLFSTIGKGMFFLGAAGGGTAIALWLLRQKPEDDEKSVLEGLADLTQEIISTTVGGGKESRAKSQRSRERDRFNLLGRLRDPLSTRKAARGINLALQKREKSRKESQFGGTGLLGSLFDIF